LVEAEKFFFDYWKPAIAHVKVAGVIGGRRYAFGE
jgi:hypothetical protein